MRLTDKPSDLGALSHRMVPRMSQPDTHVKQEATPERACIHSFAADPLCHQPQQGGGARRAGMTWSRNMGEMKSWLWLGQLAVAVEGALAQLHAHHRLPESQLLGFLDPRAKEVVHAQRAVQVR